MRNVGASRTDPTGILALADELEPFSKSFGGEMHQQEAIFANGIEFARYQCFVLGYYYGALGQLIVDTQLKTREAFGSWGWWDKEIFRVFTDMRWEAPSNLLSTPKTEGVAYCWRFGILKVMAYLFAGADLRLIRLPGLLDLRAMGVAAKLCVLTASMVGEGHDTEEASKFYLLNIDRSCIPNTSGVILAGTAVRPKPRKLDPTMLEGHQFQIPDDMLRGARDDFTIHIEPDWDHDRNKCMLVYRDSGRIVYRLSPVDADAAVALVHDQPKTLRGKTLQSTWKLEADDAIVVPLDTFHGESVITRLSQVETTELWASHRMPPEMFDKALVIPTKGLPRAKTCLMAMCQESVDCNGRTPKAGYPLRQEFEDAHVLYDKDARPIVIL